MELVLQNHLYARQRGVSAALAEAVDRDVQTACAAENGSKRVAHGKVVVVVCVEIEVQVRVAFHHLAEELDGLQRVHYAQRVGQHEPLYIGIAQRVDHHIDVVRRVFHAVAPVFEIEIDADAALLGILQRPAYFPDVLLRSLVELMGAVLQRPFGQQIDDPAATLGNPVDRQMAVDEAQHLHPIEHVYLTGVTANHLHGVLLALRNPRRSHLDAVDIDVAQQHPRYLELLVRQKRDTACLLAVAQRAVHYLDERLYAVAGAVHLLSRSHCSILSLFSIR